MSTTTAQPAWTASSGARASASRAILLRIWRRIQYPGGPASRQRLHEYRQRPGTGW